MNRVALALTVAFFGYSAHADVGESSLYKALSAFAGHWMGRTQPILLTYVVSEDGVRLEGESCRQTDGAVAPEGCRAINENYLIERTRLLHDHPSFGIKPVDVVELSEGRIVLSEQSPVLSDRRQTITEELINNGQTLRFTVEQRINGRVEPKLSQQILLDRVAR